jgi:hypothetical protein
VSGPSLNGATVFRVIIYHSVTTRVRGIIRRAAHQRLRRTSLRRRGSLIRHQEGLAAPGHIEAMRFAGRSANGRWVSSEPLTGAKGYVLDVIKLASGGSMVRLRRRFVDRRRPMQRLCLYSYPCRETDRRYRIDKIFVDAIRTDRNSATIVETLIELAHKMRMDVVAEGAETFEHVSHLREIGVRSAQGYVFAPPPPRQPIPAADQCHRSIVGRHRRPR